MSDLYLLLENKISQWRKQLADLLENHADNVVSNVTLQQVLQGMRGANAMLCDTSSVDPQKGLLIRGIPLLELKNRIPEEVFFLLLTGKLPDPNPLALLQKELQARSLIPDFVWQLIESLANDTPLMTALSMAVLAMQKDSQFRKSFEQGMKKEDYWRSTLEDSLDLVAKLPGIAAGIYRMKVKGEKPITENPFTDFAGNFVHQLGLENHQEMAQLIRLLLISQCDHEGGNVCNLTCQIVNSVLSDPYYAYSAGIQGLAGPLHGLANQHIVRLILQIRDDFGGVPNDQEITGLVWDRLNQRQIIPGFGHAVLRDRDPRFEMLHEFGSTHCHGDDVFEIADKFYRIVPDILKKQGKVKMPYPNIDAISGPLLHHFGITNLEFYTVLFAVSFSLGMCAQMVVNRALMMPIFRPRSVTTEQLKQFAKHE